MAAFIKSKLSLTGTALWTSGPEKITLYPRYLDEPEVECPVEEPSSSTGSLFRVALQIQWEKAVNLIQFLNNAPAFFVA